MLQHRHIDKTVALGHPNALAKIAQGFRCIAAAAQTGNRRHPGIVPAGNMPAFDQLAQFTFAHDRIRQIQASELDLPRPGINIEA